MFASFQERRAQQQGRIRKRLWIWPAGEARIIEVDIYPFRIATDRRGYVLPVYEGVRPRDFDHGFHNRKIKVWIVYVNKSKNTQRQQAAEWHCKAENEKSRQNQHPRCFLILCRAGWLIRLRLG